MSQAKRYEPLGTHFYPLGEGSYNKVFINPNPTPFGGPEGNVIYWVVKSPTAKMRVDQLLSNPARAVDVWKTINPGIPVHLAEDGRSWSIPYIDGYQPTPRQVLATVKEIFDRTGYLMIDAYNAARRNFIRTKTGEVVCIDMDLAIKHDEYASEVYMREVFSTAQHLYAAAFASHRAQGMGEVVDFIKSVLTDSYEAPALADEQPTIPYRYQGDSPSLAKQIFLDAHRRDREAALCCTSTHINSEMSLSELKKHASSVRKSCCFFQAPTRTGRIMKDFGWLDQQNRIIEGSGLDQALQDERRASMTP